MEIVDLQYYTFISVYNIKRHISIFVGVGNAIKSTFQFQTKAKGYEKGHQRLNSQLAAGGSNFFLVIIGME